MLTRSERYKQLRASGFTAKQARQRRDWTPRRITKAIAQKRAARRREIPSAPTTARQPTSGISPIDIRKANFNRWTSNKIGFPVRYQKIIDAFNRKYKFDQDDDFGYRMFWRLYVYGIKEDEALKQIDEGRGSP